MLNSKKCIHIICILSDKMFHFHKYYSINLTVTSQNKIKFNFLKYQFLYTYLYIKQATPFNGWMATQHNKVKVLHRYFEGVIVH